MWVNTKRPGAAKDETIGVTSFAALGRFFVVMDKKVSIHVNYDLKRSI